MEIRFNIASYFTVCICYPQIRLWECLLRELVLYFIVCLLTNCSSDVNTTGKCWCICILPMGHILFECLGENVGLHSVIIPKRFLQIRCSWP
jgi:hypothetical protein